MQTRVEYCRKSYLTSSEGVASGGHGVWFARFGRLRAVEIEWSRPHRGVVLRLPMLHAELMIDRAVVMVRSMAERRAVPFC